MNFVSIIAVTNQKKSKQGNSTNFVRLRNLTKRKKKEFVIKKNKIGQAESKCNCILKNISV